MYRKLRSSSIHRLNADKGLTRSQQLGFQLLNYLNGVALPNLLLDRNLSVREFTDFDLASYPVEVPITDSPSRLLSNLFWVSLDWAKIKEELGDVHVLDIGCGNGHYARRLLQWSGGRLSSYHGVDITERDEWNSVRSELPTATFAVLNDHSDWSSHIRDKTNLIVSQSALEHIEEDLTCFRTLADTLAPRRKPVLQLHLVPSEYDFMKLFGYHGLRQYSARSISMITSLFSRYSQSVLFRLGGRACNDLHYEFIRRPLRQLKIDLRDTMPAEYSARLLQAVSQDRTSVATTPSFYAFAIHSHPGTSLFPS
jgi:SAM-dependent methyltransferase